MTENVQPIDQYWKDPHGIEIHVTGYDAERQRVIYRRVGYEWDCACPLIMFRARFTRIKR